MSQSIVLVGQTTPALSAENAPVGAVEKRLSEAFDWALAASRALPEKELASLNVDIGQAVITVTGALPRILSYRTQLAALPDFDLSHVDTLAWHVNALFLAEGQYMAACRGPARVAELVKEARTWRALLLQDLAMMVTRRRLYPSQVEHVKGPASHRQLSLRLLAAINLYRNRWPALAGHTTVREPELIAASQIVEQLFAAYSFRKDRDKAIHAANDQRRRNFTLVAQAYDQVRRGLSYLRWNGGDAEKIAPSLYRGRGGSRPKGKRPAAKAEPAQGTAAPPDSAS